MSLRIEFDSPKGFRPKAGQIFLLRTTVGYIPVGVTSTEAFYGACAMLHPYRALVQDVTDTSYYPLVEKNDLLIPPVMLPKEYFRKGGCFAKNSDKNAPAPVPFDKYYYYFASATAWNPREFSFAPARIPFPHDRLPDFDPISERKIKYFLHDSNPPMPVETDYAPEGTRFIDGQGIVLTTQLDFSIEDSLAYYGLIDTPRPPHADFSDDDEPKQKEVPTPMTPEQFLHLADIEGTSTLFAAMDQAPEQVVEAITAAGHEPNGYFFEALATYLISLHDLDGAGIEADSEAGMFSLLGNSATVTAMHEHLLGLLRNPAELTTTIQQAEAAGHEFDD